MKINVLNENDELYIESYQNQNLLTVLLENNVNIPNSCCGNGTCGKCKIKVISGYLSVTEADRKKLTENELKEGVRLACKAIIEEKETEEQLSIEIIGKSEDDIVVEGIGRTEAKKEFQEKKRIDSVETKEQDLEGEGSEVSYFVAVDIGTTTIAMVLVNGKTGEVCDTYTSLNHQRKYGADVISRITSANAGKTEELKHLIEEDLRRGVETLVGANWGNGINLTKVVIAGNTTMIHLLMGYSCTTLGKYPFESEYLEKIECQLKDCVGDNFLNPILEGYTGFAPQNICQKYSNIPVTIFPGISAFIGGDIVAGVLSCGGFETEELSLLLDLGTNGEMVLGNKDKLLTASAAAGPAFEGGNITCGTASIPGSISQVKIQNQRAVVKTIKNQIPPHGICGTGLISVIAQLIKNQLVNEEGVLKQPYDKKGFPLWIFENGEKIALYQKDVREFQMAKSAIRTGIEILMEEYGCVPEEIKNVYVAGGFGKAIDIEDILTIGMIPEVFKDKISIIGNGALQGAVCFGSDKANAKRIESICEKAENILLSQNEMFQKRYLEYMKM